MAKDFQGSESLFPSGGLSEAHRDALRFIAGHTGDTPSLWLTMYREKGGRYEGLQAVAETALLAVTEYGEDEIWGRHCWFTPGGWIVEGYAGPLPDRARAEDAALWLNAQDGPPLTVVQS